MEVLTRPKKIHGKGSNDVGRFSPFLLMGFVYITHQRPLWLTAAPAASGMV